MQNEMTAPKLKILKVRTWARPDSPLNEMLLGAVGQGEHELACKVTRVVQVMVHHLVGPVLRHDVAFEYEHRYRRPNGGLSQVGCLVH